MLNIILTAMALQTGAVQTGGAFSESSQALSQAWASGDVRQALRAFESAFDAASEGPCAISPYAAGLAYRVGLLDASGYHFNMALRIDARVGGLTSEQREVAQSMKTEPGERVGEDRLFLFSPYADEEAELGVCADLSLPALPEVEAGAGETAIIYVRAFWTGPSRRRELSEIVLLDAYPPSEGADLANRMIGYRVGYGEWGWDVDWYAFTPCMRTSTRWRVYEVCREGFEAYATQAD